MIDETIIEKVIWEQGFYKNPAYIQRLFPNGYIGHASMGLDFYLLEAENADVFTDRRGGIFHSHFKRELTLFNTYDIYNEQQWEMYSAGNTFLHIVDDMQNSHTAYSVYRTPHYQATVGFGVGSDVKAMFDVATEPAVQLALKMSTQFT